MNKDTKMKAMEPRVSDNIPWCHHTCPLYNDQRCLWNHPWLDVTIVCVPAVKIMAEKIIELERSKRK